MARKVLITGASSGIGRDIARYFDSLGCELILVARRKDRLKALANCLNGTPKIIAMDIGDGEKAKELYELTKGENIDILINNAGFGVWGDFTETSCEREIEMLRLNVEAMHVLFKLFLKDFKSRGPYMAAYYSCKAYVLRLTQSAAYELKEENSAVTVSALCPGPVSTEFNKVAGVHFSVKPLKSKYVAKYAVLNLIKGKTVIIPGISMKIAAVASKVVPDSVSAGITAKIQKRKGR